MTSNIRYERLTRITADEFNAIVGRKVVNRANDRFYHTPMDYFKLGFTANLKLRFIGQSIKTIAAEILRMAFFSSPEGHPRDSVTARKLTFEYIAWRANMSIEALIELLDNELAAKGTTDEFDRFVRRARLESSIFIERNINGHSAMVPYGMDDKVYNAVNAYNKEIKSNRGKAKVIKSQIERIESSIEHLSSEINILRAGNGFEDVSEFKRSNAAHIHDAETMLEVLSGSRASDKYFRAEMKPLIEYRAELREMKNILKGRLKEEIAADNDEVEIPPQVTYERVERRSTVKTFTVYDTEGRLERIQALDVDSTMVTETEVTDMILDIKVYTPKVHEEKLMRKSIKDRSRRIMRREPPAPEINRGARNRRNA